MSHRGVQADVGALGAAQVEPAGDGFHRKDGLPTEPRCNRKLVRIALAARQQVGLLAIKPA